MLFHTNTIGTLLAFALLPVISSAQAIDDAKITSDLDKVSIEIGKCNYKAAAQALFPVIRLMPGLNNGAPLKSFADKPTLAKDEQGVKQLVTQLRESIVRREFGKAYSLSFSLGMSLAALDSHKTPDERFSQANVAASEAHTGRATLLSPRQLMFPAYEAKQNEIALRNAKFIVESANGPKPPTEAGTYRHDAHTVIGLIAFDQGNLELAKTELLAATVNMKDMSVRAGEPRFTLAERILQSGDPVSVVAYLDACLKVDAWPSAKAKLRRFLTAAREGNLKTFGPSAALLY